MAYTHLDPGKELEVHCFVYYGTGKLDISDLVTLSLEDLDNEEQVSVEKEKKIYETICGKEKEWLEQAQQTVCLRRAKAYLRTPSTKHTSNQWAVDQYGLHERSNMVYKMTWRVYENTRWDREAERSVPVSYDLTWYLFFNTPQNPDHTGPGRQIAGQERKHFGDKATMEKYLQGRIAAHAHLFTEISPPIPKGEEGRFSVNGVLLPGYTVEVPEPTPQEVADGLLDLLDDEDITVPKPLEEQASPPENLPPKPAVKRHPPHTHRKSAPTR